MIEFGIFSIGSTLGILLGIFLGHALAIRRGKIQTRHNAAIKLKKEFRRSTLEIEKGGNPTIVINPDVYHRQHEAAMEYAATLEGRNLRKFNLTVNEFTEWFSVVCNQSRAERMYRSNHPNYLKIKAKDPLALIANMLKYANT